MSIPPFALHRFTEPDWPKLRALRLEMIADTPHAYLETLADAEAHDEAEWRMRAARNANPGSFGLVAVLTDGEQAGRWVGTMAAYLPEGAPGALLVGVYVAPDWRGAASGVSDALLGGIEEWAATHGDVLTLEVHQDSIAARRFYKRHGFEETGTVIPYPLNPAQLELEMAKPLGARRSGGARLLGGS
jgi:GNAT superfamily N-acetyltransferase